MAYKSVLILIWEIFFYPLTTRILYLPTGSRITSFSLPPITSPDVIVTVSVSVLWHQTSRFSHLFSWKKHIEYLVQVSHFKDVETEALNAEVIWLKLQNELSQDQDSN